MGKEDGPKVEKVEKVVLNQLITNADDWDRLVWSDLSGASPLVKEQSKPLEYPQFLVDITEVSRDLFCGLYKVEPSITSDEATHREAFQAILNTEEFKDLRRSTVLDDIGSGIAWSTVMPTLRDRLQDIYAQRAKNKENPSKSLSKDEIQALRAGMKKAAEQAQGEVESYAAIAKGFGMDKEDFKSRPFEERWPLVERLLYTKKVQKVATFLGRFQNQLETAKTKKWNVGHSEIHDITPTQDLNRLLPQEYLKLQTNPALFMKDLFEQNLLGYRLASPTPDIKGPIVACVDCSYSMEGDRNEWSVALVMALALLASQQKRDCYIVFFNTETTLYSFPKNATATIEQRLQLLSHGVSGGTDFNIAIHQALKLIENQANKADIMFITDGEGRIDPDYVKQINNYRKENGMKFVSVIIDSSSDVLEKISDLSLNLNDGELHANDNIDVLFSKMVA